jgi:FkbM family methyltransferase
MLIDLATLIAKYNLDITGILHIGAHECEELPKYEQLVSRDKILWIEAMPIKVALCQARFPGIQIEQAAVSDTEEDIKFNVANNGQSSSILDLELHCVFHPDVKYITQIPMRTTLLKNILPKYTNNIKFNFINLDIQGTEIRALKGMSPYLSKIDYIYTEVNSDYVYKDCALIGEMDEFLSQYGFKRVETEWFENCQWGDAFYIHETKRADE